MAVSSQKFFADFISSNKSIVQSKAPPLNDILWRWLTFPKNHQTHSLPCTSKEVFSKQSIGQGFKRRVEPDYQDSKFLKAPKSSSKSPKSQKEKESSKKEEVKAQSQEGKKEKKEKKHKKEKKQKKKVKEEKKEQPVVADDWNVDFGGDGNEDIVAMDAFNGDSKANIVSDDDFFAAASEQNDIFGTVEDVKQPKVEKTEQVKEKDLVQQHNEENAAMNGFNAGFDDNFDFGNNKDLDIAKENVETVKDNGGFGGDWSTNFDGEDLFASNEQNTNNEQPQNEEEDVDNLFAGLLSFLFLVFLR